MLTTWPIAFLVLGLVALVLFAFRCGKLKRVRLSAAFWKIVKLDFEVEGSDL